MALKESQKKLMSDYHNVLIEINEAKRDGDHRKLKELEKKKDHYYNLCVSHKVPGFVHKANLDIGMHQELIKEATQKDSSCLEKAADYLNSAAEIFEDLGMIKNADKVLNILLKIAQDNKTTKQTNKLSNQEVNEETLKNSDNEMHDFEDEKD